MRRPRLQWSAGRAPPLLFVLALGCGRATVAQPAAVPDQPVPSSEPRESLDLVVDLEPSSSCEEDFDLALYTDRGVDLIQWDGAREACVARRVTIRFLPNRLERDALMRRVRELAVDARRPAPK